MYDAKDLIKSFLDRMEKRCKQNNNEHGVKKVKELREKLYGESNG